MSTGTLNRQPAGRLLINPTGATYIQSEKHEWLTDGYSLVRSDVARTRLKDHASEWQVAPSAALVRKLLRTMRAIDTWVPAALHRREHEPVREPRFRDYPTSLVGPEWPLYLIGVNGNLWEALSKTGLEPMVSTDSITDITWWDVRAPRQHRRVLKAVIKGCVA